MGFVWVVLRWVIILFWGFSFVDMIICNERYFCSSGVGGFVCFRGIYFILNRLFGLIMYRWVRFWIRICRIDWSFL